MSFNKYECGIYKIENIMNGKFYIGGTSNFKNRFLHHKGRLRSNKHANRHLQGAWNKYSEQSFIFIKILICSKEDLVMYEQLFLDHYKSYESNIGYNLARVVVFNGKADIEVSEDTKKKMSESQKGKIRRKHTQETKDKIGAAHIGNKYRLGKKSSNETRNKISIGNKGKIRTEETKLQISKKNKGKKPAPQTIEAIKKANIGRSPPNKGKLMTDEQKK